jgi:hypothetical protein
MSMDTGGTDRMIKRQIKEWHALAESERNAKLLKSASSNEHRSLGGLIRHTATAIRGPLATLRVRLSRRPVA